MSKKDDTAARIKSDKNIIVTRDRKPVYVKDTLKPPKEEPEK